MTTIHQQGHHRGPGTWLLWAALALGACGDDAADSAPDAATGLDSGAMNDSGAMRDAPPSTDAGADASDDAQPPQPDGSTDAGSTDAAAATDAGSDDAGPIIVIPDAGSTDAGSTDAAANDAGSDDAGPIIIIPDAGSTDAGSTDAAVTDAATDAAANDASTCPGSPATDFGDSCFSGDDCSSGICWMSPLVAGGCQRAGCSTPCETDAECQCHAAEAGADDPNEATCVSGSCDLTDTGLGQILLCS